MQVRAWKEMYNYWLAQDIPLFILRFEDLLTQPEETMTDLFKFLLKTDDLEGTQILKSIQDITQVGGRRREIYKPRRVAFNQCMDKYS